jgi:hypothetical protein
MNWKMRISTLLALAGATLWLSPHALSQGNSMVYAPDEVVLGKTCAEWSAQWWQWAFSFPVPVNPILDTTGERSMLGQSADVFFVPGFAPGGPVTVQYTVPSGKPLLAPLISAEFSDLEPAPYHGDTDAERLTNARAWIDAVGPETLKLSIDGVAVEGLTQYRMSTPPYDFLMPAQQNLLDLAGATFGRSAADGYWVMVKPLSRGAHVIHSVAGDTSGPLKGYVQDYTAQITAR